MSEGHQHQENRYWLNFCVIIAIAKTPLSYCSEPGIETKPKITLMALSARRAEGYDSINSRTLENAGMVIILEAQMSHTDDDLWYGLIKDQTGFYSGPRIAIPLLMVALLEALCSRRKDTSLPPSL
ncbi:hypothetical protein N7489_007901 [Penicillium chrysogenum]|jgi:hypothetical protein|uniref:uncharacterized protein n=1 Tax=Penicillium chrysogenum TaxID=5076 RepID=UPI002381EDDC|nr:uncharacterized protein N7489_007901 [Penicillium chrysogenum]KAJ5237810.1 hypothetical protein N7489_007901 [Penicillium chrysogenum]KAJ5278111.1 hypothetical protein N7524_004264 [Penicillium chrysogenum]